MLVQDFHTKSNLMTQKINDLQSRLDRKNQSPDRGQKMVSFERTLNNEKRSTFDSQTKRMTNQFDSASNFDSPISPRKSAKKRRSSKAQGDMSDASPFSRGPKPSEAESSGFELSRTVGRPSRMQLGLSPRTMRDSANRK